MSGSASHILRELLAKIAGNPYAVECDLIDPITIFIATGLRRLELSALLWVDLHTTAGTVGVRTGRTRISGGQR
ncbi:hypothetical protein [Mycobacterium sp. 155]|uniref:hypothetical protein n=1 Tax=Mycobacterium sp. 155 TaxID=1157943 RepID=UPI000476622B|nr:hypothetical protein [Mycobacterium sp. 155]